MATAQTFKKVQTVVNDLYDILKTARNVLVSSITAWIARMCVYPYAFLLGMVTVVALFQLINLFDSPYAVAPRRSRVSDEIEYDDGNPGGPPVRCHWDVLIVSSMRTLSKSPEYAALTTRLKRSKVKDVSSSLQPFEMDLTCTGKPSQIPCSLKVVVSTNVTDMRNKDAVIFGMPATSVRGKPSQFGTDSPTKIKSAHNQLWVLFAMSSPLELRATCPELGSFPVHMVWSYLSVSQLTTPYAAYVAGGLTDPNSTASGETVAGIGISFGKRRLIAWMGDNCGEDAFWPRKAYLSELARHIPVDMYGECSNLTCMPRSSEQCGMLMGQYKFFLAFENAECKEYVTEQFWVTALEHHTVPVVYGPRKDTYLKFAPPNSFIHAADFESPKALAEYLRTLDKNDGLYARFFKWRNSGSIKIHYPLFKPESLCKILPHIEDVKIGRLKRQLVSKTKWYGSCRNRRNATAKQNTLDGWTPWR